MTNYRLITVGEDYYMYSTLTKAVTSVLMGDGYEEWANEDEKSDENGNTRILCTYGG